MQEDGKPKRQDEDLQEREVVICVKSQAKMKLSVVTLSVCLSLVLLTRHTDTLLSTLSQLFPHSVSANEFEDGFLNESLTMLQQQSGCLRNAPVSVCFPGSGLYACCDNLHCQLVQEDETYDSGQGVRQVGVVFESGGLKHCGFTGLSAEDPRTWCKRRYRPDSTNGMRRWILQIRATCG